MKKINNQELLMEFDKCVSSHVISKKFKGMIVHITKMAFKHKKPVAFEKEYNKLCNTKIYSNISDVVSSYVLENFDKTRGNSNIFAYIATAIFIERGKLLTERIPELSKFESMKNMLSVLT